MSKGLNQCTFIGNLGQDPEMNTTPSGSQVANFSIAVSDAWKDKNTGEKRESTEWIRIVAWNALADVVGKYIKKGSKVFVAGKMQTRSWEDANGVKKFMTEIVARDIIMLDGHQTSDNGTGNGQQEAVAAGGGGQFDSAEYNDDDLPF
jgi:single-strand DNA-binding protein